MQEREKMQQRDNKLARLIGTGIYSGYFPIASGTAGTAAAFVFYYILKWIGFMDAAGWFVYVLFLFWIVVLGLWSADVLEKSTSKKDPSIVVIDEIAGYFFAVAFLPVQFKYAVGAFILFRFFDVVKVPPAAVSEKLKGGVGIMLDDIIAGIYTCIILHLLRVLF